MKKHDKDQVVITKEWYQKEKEKEKIAIMNELGVTRVVENKSRKYKKITDLQIQKIFQKQFKQEVSIDSIFLKEWTDDIPLGVLYKVKEAKEEGFDDFPVYFPTTVRRSNTVLSDPLIVGHKKTGKCRISHDDHWDEEFCSICSNEGHKGTIYDNREHYKIAAWDDGKIY